jgi:antitoxin (DNA-binding transcriptional repressor) of toxin-antitoxin stability system
MSEMPISDAEGHLADLSHEAEESGEVIYLTDHGRRVSAIVPANAAAAMEAAEDAADAAAAEAALAEPGENILLEDLLAELGL